MPAVLNTNAASLYASKNLQSAQSKMAQSVERLSSGLRINRAKDDAAGLGIANALTSQINGANQGIRNLNDGISMVQTAEGAIAAAQEMAQRILTLATQGANGTMGTSDRTAIQNEMKQLLTAIDAIGGRTKFSGNSLLNNDARTSGATAAPPTTTKFSLQTSNQTTDVIALAANAFLNIGGFSSKAQVYTIATAASGSGAADGALKLVSGSTALATLKAGMSITSSANIGVDASISSITNNTDIISAVVNTGTAPHSQDLVFGSTIKSGADRVIALASGANPTQSIVGTTAYKVASSGSGTYTALGTVKSIDGNFVTITGTANVTITHDETVVFSGQLTQIHSSGDVSLSVAVGADLTTASGATAAFQKVQRAADAYLTALTTQRSLLGAYQNQIEYTVSNVTELSANLDAARSNVQDTDYASETATLTKGQILQQAATAMLAQANQMPNVILSLLK
jgi:flagellin